MEFLLSAMHKGGPAMWPILTVAIFAMLIVVERVITIFRSTCNATVIMHLVQRCILSREADRALKLLSALRQRPLVRVLRAGLLCANRTEPEIQNAVDEAVLEVYPELNKHTGYLPMLANVATLTGLLGTIHGLIIAFEAVAHASAETKQTLLAAGISTAMFTTASGLVVAIPTLILHSLISSWTTKTMDEIDHCAFKLVNLLAVRQRAEARR